MVGSYTANSHLQDARIIGVAANSIKLAANSSKLAQLEALLLGIYYQLALVWMVEYMACVRSVGVQALKSSLC